MKLGFAAFEFVNHANNRRFYSNGMALARTAGIERITIKPNFNSGDPPPNSTDIPFLVALIRLLRDYGAGRIVVGESTRHPPTNAYFEMQRTGVFDACRRAGAEVVVFGDEHWMPVRTRGERFGWVEVARPMIECDRLVYACCLKTHWLTKFSMSLKLVV